MKKKLTLEMLNYREDDSSGYFCWGCMFYICLFNKPECDLTEKRLHAEEGCCDGFYDIGNCTCLSRRKKELEKKYGIIQDGDIIKELNK